MKIDGMNHYFYCLFLLALLSCASTKEEGKSHQVSLPPPHINCPENGDCSFEIMKNSVLQLNHSASGELYPEVVSGNKVVVKFHYEKETPKDVMDAGYSEYVYLEFDPAEKQLILKDKELQKVKMIFGRICYCKGAMGYFPIQNGNLFLFNQDGNLQLRTTFKVNKVPQIVQHIDENINY